MRTRFGVFDVLRILSGLVLLNAILSYWFTGTSMWGYEGKYTDTAFLKFKLTGSPMRQFTSESLEKELDHSGRLLLSINHTVFDVTRNAKTYDPRAKIKPKYSCLIGKDCTRLFINGCFNDSLQCTPDLRNIGFEDEYVKKTISSWVHYYDNHPQYWKVGYLQPTFDDITTNEPPEKCMTGIQYPRKT